MGGGTLYALQVYKCQWWVFNSQKRRRYWPNFKWINFNKINLKASTLQKRVTLPLLHLEKKTTPELTSSWQSIYLTADFSIEKL